MDSTAMATANAVLTSPGGSPKTMHFATLVTSPLFYNAPYVLGSSEKSCQGPGQHGATVVPCVAKKEPCKSDAKSCRAINLWMMNSLPGLDAKKKCSQQNGPSSVTSWCQGGFHANFMYKVACNIMQQCNIHQYPGELQARLPGTGTSGTSSGQKRADARDESLLLSEGNVFMVLREAC